MLHERLLYGLEGSRTDRQTLTLAQRDSVPVLSYFGLKTNSLYALCVPYWCNAAIPRAGTGQQPYNSAQHRFTADLSLLQEIKIKIILDPALLGFLTCLSVNGHIYMFRLIFFTAMTMKAEHSGHAI